jgi:hypothetical protein
MQEWNIYETAKAWVETLKKVTYYHPESDILLSARNLL